MMDLLNLDGNNGTKKSDVLVLHVTVEPCGFPGGHVSLSGFKFRCSVFESVHASLSAQQVCPKLCATASSRYQSIPDTAAPGGRGSAHSAPIDGSSKDGF